MPAHPTVRYTITRLEHPLDWPHLRRPRLAAFEVATEGWVTVDSKSFARLRAAFLAESRRRLPEVDWLEAGEGALAHPDEPLRIIVNFVDDQYTVDCGRTGEGWHLDAWDPAPRIEPDEVVEAAVRTVSMIQELLARLS